MQFGDITANLLCVFQIEGIGRIDCTDLHLKPFKITQIAHTKQTISRSDLIKQTNNPQLRFMAGWNPVFNNEMNHKKHI